MSITVTAFKSVTKGSLVGFATVQHQPSGMILAECPVLNGPNGPWVGTPGKPQLGSDGTAARDPATGKIKYVQVVSFSSKHERNRWSELVIEALRQAFPDVLPPTPAAQVEADLADRPWPTR